MQDVFICDPSGLNAVPLGKILASWELLRFVYEQKSEDMDIIEP